MKKNKIICRCGNTNNFITNIADYPLICSKCGLVLLNHKNSNEYYLNIRNGILENVKFDYYDLKDSLQNQN